MMPVTVCFAIHHRWAQAMQTMQDSVKLYANSAVATADERSVCYSDWLEFIKLGIIICSIRTIVYFD